MTNTDAVDHFRRKLTMETDAADVYAALESGEPGFVLVDSRNDAAWKQGRIPGAVHMPTAEIPARLHELPAGVPVVTYCWGPGCNGATKAALAFALAGVPVREMIGGMEYWVREGHPVENEHGLVTRPVDQLCGC
jgi:rhodanese-related sulfurtransferase